MTRYLLTIMLCMAVAVLPAGAVRKHTATTKNSTTKSRTEQTRTVSAEDAAEEELTYASVSRTNPFEIVPAAGMELLDDLGGGNSDMVADMISYAKKFMGTRYVRGGKSPKGFDCSGFTGYVFRQFGYNLSASSAAQATQGVQIKREEAEPGDLLFFTGRNSRSGRVGHVGIVLDNDAVTGEITFIHASVSSGISIDRVSAPYYAKRFLSVRRVF